MRTTLWDARCRWSRERPWVPQEVLQGLRCGVFYASRKSIRCIKAGGGAARSILSLQSDLNAPCTSWWVFDRKRPPSHTRSSFFWNNWSVHSFARNWADAAHDTFRLWLFCKSCSRGRGGQCRWRNGRQRAHIILLSAARAVKFSAPAFCFAPNISLQFLLTCIKELTYNNARPLLFMKAPNFLLSVVIFLTAFNVFDTFPFYSNS